MVHFLIVKQDDCIATRGEYFTIEWFYSEAGASEAEEYYANLSVKEQAKLMSLLQRMADVGKIFDKGAFNAEGDKIYAFKPQPHRFLSCFAVGKKIILLCAFHKKTQKIPPKEKRAVKLMKDYQKRTKAGTYYE